MSNFPISCWVCVLSKSKADEGCADAWHCGHSVWGTLEQPINTNDVTQFVKDEKRAPWCPLERCRFCDQKDGTVTRGACSSCHESLKQRQKMFEEF